MAADLKPILRPGATDNSQLQVYTARDFIGVERPSDTERRGVNRIAQWTEDLADWIDAEHTREGVHNTLRIPRGLFMAGFDRNGYVIDERSYLFGETYGDNPGLFTIHYNTFGDFDLELGIPMPRADWGIISACPPQGVLTSDGNHSGPAWVYGRAISETMISIRRFAEYIPNAQGNDGHVCFLLVG